MCAAAVNCQPFGLRSMASRLTCSGGRAKLTGMPRQAASRSRKLLYCALSWQLAIPVALAFADPHTAAAQEGVERPSLLVLPAHPSASSAKMSAGVGENVESVLVTHLQRSGYEVARVGRAQAASCSAADYVCVAKAGKQEGSYVLDPLVQVNPDGTGYFTFTIADTKHADNISNESVALGTPDSGRPLAKEIEKNAEQITQAVNKLLKRVSGSPGTPAVTESPRAALGASSKTLTLELTGRGDVSSLPEGIKCPGHCTYTFAPDLVSQGSFTLTATPRLPASVVHWSGVPCINSELADPLRCQVVLNKDERLRVSFDRSTTRKAFTGLFWSLAAIGIVSGAVLLPLHGQNHPCFSDSSQTCTYNTRGLGAASLSIGVGFAIAGALTFWLPR